MRGAALPSGAIGAGAPPSSDMSIAAAPSACCCAAGRWSDRRSGRPLLLLLLEVSAAMCGKLQAPRREQTPSWANSKQCRSTWSDGCAWLHRWPLCMRGHVFVLCQLWHMPEVTGRGASSQPQGGGCRSRCARPRRRPDRRLHQPELHLASRRSCRSRLLRRALLRRCCCAQGRRAARLRVGADVCAVEAVALAALAQAVPCLHVDRRPVEQTAGLRGELQQPLHQLLHCRIVVGVDAEEQRHLAVRHALTGSVADVALVGRQQLCAVPAWTRRTAAP